MVNTSPQPNQDRFSPVSLEAVTLACLSTKSSGVSLSKLRQSLRSLAPHSDVDAAVLTLAKRDQVAVAGTTITLTAAGRTAGKRLLGVDSEADWKAIKLRRLPLLVLGLDPDDDGNRRRFANVETLKAAAITIAFGLPKEAITSVKAVRSELVWLLLTSIPNLVGKGPFPVIEKPGIVERTLLAGLAGVKAKTMKDALNGVTALSVGLKKVASDTLRERLIQIGLHRSAASLRPGVQTASVGTLTNGGMDAFASQVREVAKTLTTPPFQGRVAIAQVYDAYGRVHQDAGSLASFKERLVEAAKARQVDLARLDLPEHMSKELRQRSEARWGTDEVHFVIVGRN